MKIIEKKCPNCGAGLEFDNNAKSCKCEYCKRSFVIEREANDRDFYSPNNYILEQKSFNVVSLIIVFTSIFIMGVIIIASMHFSNSKNNSYLFNSEPEDVMYTKVNELSDFDLEQIDSQSYWVIEKKNQGLHDYHLDMNVKREKLYVACDKKNMKNMIIGVYKARYYILGNSENIYEIYVPVIYENVFKKDSSISFQLDKGYVKASEYYFNLEHSEFAYGYKEIETIEKEVISPLKEKYKLSEK